MQEANRLELAQESPEGLRCLLGYERPPDERASNGVQDSHPPAGRVCPDHVVLEPERVITADLWSVPRSMGVGIESNFA